MSRSSTGYNRFTMEDRERLLKKIFIASVFFIFLSGVGFGIYYFAKSPVLPNVIPPVIYPVKTIWVQSFNIGPNLYSVGAKISNPNVSFGVRSLRYSLYLYDEAGNLLISRTNASFIWPGENKYLVEGGFNLSIAPVRVDLVFESPEWLEVRNFQGVDLAVANKNFRKLNSKEGGFFQITSNVFNGTAFNFKEVEVVAVVFDDKQSPISVNKTVLDDLRSGGTRPANFLWFSPFSGTPEDIDVSATTNLWEIPGFFSQ